METFVTWSLIVVGTGIVWWEIRCLAYRIVQMVNDHSERLIEEEEISCEDMEDVEEAVGESTGVPVIIGVMRGTGNHPTITCEICDNEQCLTCNGQTCVKCGCEIAE